LEDELDSTRERLVLRENENQSFQASLDLIVSENSRLWSRLRDSNVAVEEARSQLEQLKTALGAVEIERNKLASAVADRPKSDGPKSTRRTLVSEPCRHALSLRRNCLWRRGRVCSRVPG
jgi:hypothetical protein